MSLFNKFLNIFGFGHYEDDDDFLPSKDKAEGTSDKPHIHNSVDAEERNTQKKTVVDTKVMEPLRASDEMVHKIFDKVVEITNSSVPDYLAKSLDTEKQKIFLYKSLDESIKKYLSDLEVQADAKSRAQWQCEYDKLQSEKDALQKRTKELEAKHAEIKEQKLSAERQKRALNERVHDLENAIRKLEADKEQLEITNSSLINKAKVANIYESDIEQMRSQIEQLKSNPDTMAIVDENNKLKAKLGELNSDIERLTKNCKEAKVKDEMNTAMLNDLQKLASESQKTAKNAETIIEDLKKDLALQDAQIADLRKDIAEKEVHIKEADEAFEEINEIVEHIERFEAVKRKLENKVKELKEALRQAQNENETLKTTIKNNLYAHAQQEKEMKDQIDKLRATLQAS